MFKITDKDKLIHRLEADNKKPIRKFLKTLNPDGYFFSIAQGAFSKMGISDTLGVYDGQFFAFECKSKDGGPTALQKAFLRLVTAAGGIGGVVKCVADVKELLLLKHIVPMPQFGLLSGWPQSVLIKHCTTLAKVYLKFCTTKQALKLLNRWDKKNIPALSEENIKRILGK